MGDLLTHLRACAGEARGFSGSCRSHSQGTTLDLAGTTALLLCSPAYSLLQPRKRSFLKWLQVPRYKRPSVGTACGTALDELLPRQVRKRIGGWGV